MSGIYYQSVERFEIPGHGVLQLTRIQKPGGNEYYSKSASDLLLKLTEKEYFAKLREAKQDLIVALASAKPTAQPVTVEATVHEDGTTCGQGLAEWDKQARKDLDAMTAATPQEQWTQQHRERHAQEHQVKMERKELGAEKVDHPAHYGGSDNPFEHIKIVDAWGLDYRLGNATKYICRAGKKDSATLKEDLSKALWYITDKEKHERERGFPSPISMPTLATTVLFGPKASEICTAWGLVGAEGASPAMVVEALERYLLAQSSQGRATALQDAKGILQAALKRL